MRDMHVVQGVLYRSVYVFAIAVGTGRRKALFFSLLEQILGLGTVMSLCCTGSVWLCVVVVGVFVQLLYTARGEQQCCSAPRMRNHLATKKGETQP